MKCINFNGRLLRKEEVNMHAANITPTPLFETILLENGKAQLTQHHWDRLALGLQHFDLSLPPGYTNEWFKQQAIATAQANNMEGLCRLRLTVYAQQAETVSFAFFAFEAFALEPAIVRLNDRGLHLGMVDSFVKSGGESGNLKTWNVALYEKAKHYCEANGLDDLLVKNTSGNIIESTIANLFLMAENGIYTPPLADGCVAGVMRRFVIDRLAGIGIRVQERSLQLDDLHNAEELFLTNAIRRIKWVERLDDRVYTNLRTKELYEELFGNSAPD